MLDLVWKDLVVARRPLMIVLPFGVLQLAATASVGPVFLPAALLLAAVLAFGSIPIEEAQRTEILWNSLPVRRGTIVAARYVTALTGMLAGLGLSWVVAQVVSRLMGNSGAPFAGFPALAMLLAILALAAAVFLPLYFCCGLGRAVILFSVAGIASMCAMAIGVRITLYVHGYDGALVDRATWEAAGPELAAWLHPRWERLLLGLVTGSGLAMALSLLLARRLYETRDL